MLKKNNVSLISINIQILKNIFQYTKLIYGNLMLEKKNYLQKIW